ncbi:MAG: aldehyde dehydrogenase family protein, partial [Candidatus Eisenbacteria bacterium]
MATRAEPKLRSRPEWTYAPAPESADPGIRKRYGLFIDGAFVPAQDGRTRTILNPATEEPLCEVAEGGARDVDRAVKAARRAYTRVWSKLPARERGKYMFRLARLLQERAREFAVAESKNGGKPIRESRDTDIPL